LWLADDHSILLRHCAVSERLQKIPAKDVIFRDAEELRKQGIDAHGIVIDVDSSDSIKKAAASIEHEHGRLDILINNAGVMLLDADKSASAQPLDVWRKTFETNGFGLVATTQAFLPLLRKSDAVGS
jgi:NAD(P)-dependent dehydrogenase (short-subunit alcohol dehydrogenase family)